MSSSTTSLPNAWQFLMGLHKVCHFQSREKKGEASNSELRRWINQGSLKFNAETVSWGEPIDFPVISCQLFGYYLYA